MPKNTSSRSEIGQQPGYFHPFSFEWDATRAKEVTREEAFEEGRAEERIETTKRLTNQFVLSLLQKKASMEFITDVTHLSAEEVEKIAKEHRLAI